jgi:hypothetical protein
MERAMGIEPTIYSLGAHLLLLIVIPTISSATLEAGISRCQAGHARGPDRKIDSHFTMSRAGCSGKKRSGVGCLLSRAARGRSLRLQLRPWLPEAGHGRVGPEHAFRIARQGLSNRRSWLLANRRWTEGWPLSLVKRCDQVVDKGSR